MAFLDRFAAARTADNPLGLQILFFAPPELDAEAVLAFLRLEPELKEATGEIARVADVPGAAAFVSGEGPPAAALGLFAWGEHAVKLAQFDAPMPYGPVESCVGPAMLPPPMKVDAKQHAAHVLLFDAGTHPDVRERFVALCAVAGALARCEEAICILNEDARTACPAFDLIPDAGEDALATYRALPIPYLLGGFVRMSVGDAGVLWARTFANHRLGLPDPRNENARPPTDGPHLPALRRSRRLPARNQGTDARRRKPRPRRRHHLRPPRADGGGGLPDLAGGGAGAGVECEGSDVRKPSTTAPPMNGPATHYHSGEEIRAGDQVTCGRWSGRVAFVLGTASFAEGYAEADWAYLGRGFMIECDQVGLVFSNESDEDLVLTARGSSPRPVHLPNRTGGPSEPEA